MPADPLHKVLPGQKVTFSANAHNAFAEAAQALRQRQHDVASEPGVVTRQSSIIKVRNRTEGPLPRFGIVALGEPIIAPDDHLAAFQVQVAFEGHAPVGPIAPGRFAVLLEPLTEDAIGRAVVAGVTPVRLTLGPGSCHDFAEATAGTTQTLQTGPTGTARVLWIEESGETERWAIVRLGDASDTVFAARITGSAVAIPAGGSIAYSWTEITLDTLGRWVDRSPTNAGTLNAYPLPLFGEHASHPTDHLMLPPVPIGSRVTIWPSHRTGFYEFLPWQGANGGTPGLMTTGSQSFAGHKTFFDNVIGQSIVSGALGVRGIELVFGSDFATKGTFADSQWAAWQVTFREPDDASSGLRAVLSQNNNLSPIHHLDCQLWSVSAHSVYANLGSYYTINSGFPPQPDHHPYLVGGTELSSGLAGYNHPFTFKSGLFIATHANPGELIWGGDGSSNNEASYLGTSHWVTLAPSAEDGSYLLRLRKTGASYQLAWIPNCCDPETTTEEPTTHEPTTTEEPTSTTEEPTTNRRGGIVSLTSAAVEVQ